MEVVGFGQTQKSYFFNNKYHANTLKYSIFVFPSREYTNSTFWLPCCFESIFLVFIYLFIYSFI